MCVVYNPFLSINKLPVREVVVIYKAYGLHVAQGQMNTAPYETQTHSCRSAC